MKKILTAVIIVLLLTSCTSLHTTHELVLVDQFTSDGALDVSVVSDGIVDSQARFFVLIKNNSDTGINFFENQITFYSGKDFTNYQYLSCWNSYAFLNNLERRYSGKLSWAAFFYDMFDDDYDHHDHHDRHDDRHDDGAFTFFKIASFLNLAATGIDAVSTLEDSNASVLRSCFIPAGESICGLVSCEVPWKDNFIKVKLETADSSNWFTFSY